MHLLLQQLDVEFPSKPDNDTKNETDEEFRSPETDSFVQCSVKVIFIKTWEEFYQNLIQNHDNWVHCRTIGRAVWWWTWQISSTSLVNVGQSTVADDFKNSNKYNCCSREEEWNLLANSIVARIPRIIKRPAD